MKALATLAVGLGLALAAPAARASEAYVDVSDVHACLALPGPRTVLATGGGVVVTDGSRTRTLTALDGLPDTRTYALLARGGGVWVGTERGVAELSPRLAVQRTALDAPVRALAADGAWIAAGTFGGGVVRYDPASGRTTTAATPDPRVLALAVFGGSLYAATMGGVARRGASGAFSLLPGAADPTFALDVSPSGLVARTLTGPVTLAGRGAPGPAVSACPRPPASPLPSNDVSAIAADATGAWVGTFDRGLVRIVGRAGSPVRGVDDRIDALALDRVGRLWVGTARGLYTVDPGASAARRVDTGANDEVHALAALPGGGVLAGTSRGALVVRGSSVARIGRKQGLTALSVTAVGTLRDELLLGTTSGLFVGSAGRLTRLSVSSGHLPDDWITAVVSSGGSIYAGTYNSGVVRLARDGEGFRAERLGGGYVNPAGVAVQAGTVWIATMDGLLSRAGGGGALVRHPREALGRDVTAIAFSQSGTWVGSRRGLLRL
jgi:ligand-binding sensor domain-containing protein